MSLSEWWYSNAGWLGVAGLALGVVSPIIAIVIYRLQKERKYLTWSRGDATQISFGAADKLGVQVVYEGVALQRPCLIKFTIANSSSKAITSTDWDSDLTLAFDDARIVSLLFPNSTVRMIDEPHIFRADHTAYAILKPGTINPKEKLEVQVVVDGKLSYPRFSGKINDQSRKTIDEVDARLPSNAGMASAVGIAFLVLIVFAVPFLIFVPGPSKWAILTFPTATWAFLCLRGMHRLRRGRAAKAKADQLSGIIPLPISNGTD